MGPHQVEDLVATITVVLMAAVMGRASGSEANRGTFYLDKSVLLRVVGVTPVSSSAQGSNAGG